MGNGQDQAYQTKYQPEATVVPPARKGDGISLPDFSGSKSVFLVVIYKFDPLNIKNGVQIPSYASFFLTIFLQAQRVIEYATHPPSGILSQ
jgi:hypothetical protein